jgi:NADH-quinone oxidoreductase subunit C
MLVGPVRQRHDQTEIRVAAGSVVDVLRALHDDPAFRFEILADVAGVDTGDSMQVVYHLWSQTTPDWLRVIVVDLSRDDPRVPSATFLWKGAEWMEREAYDMFGIVFEGHPALERILTWEGFNGHPLRKDFPLEGIDTGAAIYPDVYPPGGGPVVEDAETEEGGAS